MERRPSLTIQTPSVYDSESSTPRSYASDDEMDEGTSSPLPPPPRNWWNTIVLYPTIVNSIPLLMSLYTVAMTIAVYIHTKGQFLDTLAFLMYTLLFELYVGNVFLYLTFEPTMIPVKKSVEQMNNTFMDAVLTLYESVWILLLPSPASVTVGFVSMGSMIVLLFMEQMYSKYSSPELRMVCYVVSACRRAFVIGYLMTESLPPMF